MKKIEAVIFDWAGTTVDYGCLAPVQAFVEAFKTFGIEPTAEEVRKPMGMLKIDHIRTMLQMPRISAAWETVCKRAWTEEDVKEVYKASEAGLMKILPEYVDIKPYVTETIADLRERGIKIGSTTGYTDAMMEIVVPAAKEGGYSPDSWFSPNAVNNMGRPYPYMIYRNMEVLKVMSVENVIKVGDTVADIKEGLNAGVCTVGIVEGSSIMGYSKPEYAALSEKDKEEACERVEAVYRNAGADYVIKDIRSLLSILNDQQ